MVHSGSSYASQSELLLTFGLGRDSRVASVAVEWPSGRTQNLSDVSANRVVVIEEGESR
jgi:hypothetical protein